jgi:hypothetical protein
MLSVSHVQHHVHGLANCQCRDILMEWHQSFSLLSTPGHVEVYMTQSKNSACIILQPVDLAYHDYSSSS